MDPWLTVIPIVAAGVVVGVVLFVVFAAMGKRGLGMANRMRRRLGASLELLTGCGVIAGLNRVPGVLALADGVVEFEAMLTRGAAKLSLDDVALVALENTATSKYQRTRKYRGAVALVFVLKNGEERIFVVSKADAQRWHQALHGRVELTGEEGSSKRPGTWEKAGETGQNKLHRQG